jgi:hypothetical protein
MSEHLFADGRAVMAQYHVPGVPAYRGNPFIEALPPMLEREAARHAMASLPVYDPAERLAEAIDREHMASMLSAIRKPVGLHVELHSRLSRLLRNGYVARNPVQPFFQAHIDAREQAVIVDGTANDVVVSGGYRLASGPRPSATGLTFLGLSGIGKSAAIEMCLQLYPQLIIHSEYHGRTFSRTQVTWLKLDAPPDGSILSLAERFFTAVDALHEALEMPTEYRTVYMPAKTTVQRVIPRMARLAAQHGLGVLVLDEIQDLNPRGARAILSFLVQLVNTVGIPVVLVGGIDALPILNAQFRQARRGAAEGDLIVRRAEQGRGWREFCETLWRYQYTAHESPMTDECVEALYEVSQGITSYLVLAYKLAQIRAIETGRERITPGMIRSVRDSLSQAVPVLEAIRRGNVEVLRRLGDVTVPDGVASIPFLRGDAAPVSASAPTVSRPTPASAAPAPADDGEVTPAVVDSAASSRGWRRRRSAPPLPSSPVMAEIAGEAVGTARTLPEIAADAREQGMTVHAALVQHGVIDDALWRRVARGDLA